MSMGTWKVTHVCLSVSQSVGNLPEIIIMDTMVCRPKGQIVGGAGVELDTTHVGFGLENDLSVDSCALEYVSP